MKKTLTLMAVFLLSLSSIASAEFKIPPLKEGIAYSFQDKAVNFLSTIEAIKWKMLSLEVGYAGSADESDHKAVAVVSLDCLKLKDHIQMPILDLVEFRPGLYAGYGDLNTKGLDDADFDFGVSATLLSFKF